jgi:phosphoesterase RecJ-like protein
VDVVLPNTTPGFLNWLPGHADVILFDKQRARAEAVLQQADAVFCLDFNRLDRVGSAEASLRAVSHRVLIDHHQDPEDMAEIRFSDTSAPATCQMIYDIICAMGHVELIDVNVATCLYTGLVTDTGSFRFRSTTPHTMRVAADLMERGVRIDEVHSAITDDNSPDRLRLLGFMLTERMTVLPEMGTALISLSLDDLHRFNFSPGDTEGFVNYGLSIRGIRLAAFFVERPDLVKISMRSKGDLPVDTFLRAHFNGGGHRNAAGGQSKAGLKETMEQFMRFLPELLEAHPA